MYSHYEPILAEADINTHTQSTNLLFSNIIDINVHRGKNFELAILQALVANGF